MLPNGQVFEGEFQNGEMIRGKHTCAEYYYDGEWSNGLYHGCGKIFDDSGYVCEGTFENGMIVLGKETCKEGWYDGE
jgi:hypothetical protein